MEVPMQGSWIAESSVLPAWRTRGNVWGNHTTGKWRENAGKKDLEKERPHILYTISAQIDG